MQKSSHGGRPLGFDPEKTGDALMRLFWKKGFLGASLPDLESSTGLSRSSIYNSFGSKRRIFEKSLDRYREAIGEQICLPLETGEKGLADIEGFFGTLERVLANPKSPAGCLMVNSMVEFAGNDSAVSRQSAKHMNRLRAAFAAALERAIEQGEVPPHETGPRTELLLGLVLGVCVAARAGLSRDALGSLVAGARAQVREWAAPVHGG